MTVAPYSILVVLLASCSWHCSSYTQQNQWRHFPQRTLILGQRSESLFGSRLALVLFATEDDKQTPKPKKTKAATTLSKAAEDVNIKSVPKKSKSDKTKGSTKKGGKLSKAKLQSTKKVKDNAKIEELVEKKKRKKKKTNTPIHWIMDSAEWSIEMKDDTQSEEPKLFHWAVGGNPLPLRRHRTSRGFMYNPSASAQLSFQNITEQIMSNLTVGTRKVVNETLQPLFSANQPLVLTLVFRMKRPNKHFVSSKPGPGRLRENAPSPVAITRTDVDNLAKFVMDSMNGILYEDDRQIASLHATKIYDSEGYCQGCTEVCCRIIEEDDLAHLIVNSFGPLYRRPQ